MPRRRPTGQKGSCRFHKSSRSSLVSALAALPIQLTPIILATSSHPDSHDFERVQMRAIYSPNRKFLFSLNLAGPKGLRTMYFLPGLKKLLCQGRQLLPVWGRLLHRSGKFWRPLAT